MRDSRNIIYLVVDSFRYDHSTMAGHERDTTPNLDAFAQKGQSFSNCFSHGVWTQSSTGSILTGTYPMYHNLGIDNDVLTDDVPVVPELLSEAGYHTVGVSEIANVSSNTRLDRGFEEFHFLIEKSNRELLRDCSGILPRSVTTAALNWLRSAREPSIGTKDVLRWTMPFFTNHVIKQSLAAGDNSDTFVYGHYLGPHCPYLPPPSFRDLFYQTSDMDVDDALALADAVCQATDDVIAESVDYDEELWNALIGLYDSELRYVDYFLGDLLEWIERNLDDFLVVVTADHGELLGENGLVTHGLQLADPLINVPLVVRDSTGKTIDSEQFVQHVDLATTIVSAAGGRTETLQGVDLRSETRSHALAQRGPTRAFRQAAEMNSDFDTSPFSHGKMWCLRDDEYKYVEGDSDPVLYRLPDERTDVSRAEPERAEEFAGELSSLRERYERTGSEQISTQASYSDAAREQLRDLGYM